MKITPHHDIKATAWRNRIVGSGEERPDQLLANPANWRIHPSRQQQALAGSLDIVGWVQQVMVNRRTGFVVDGHARVALAISRNEPTVPVLYVDLAPEEEAIVLASLDPIAAMAATDDAQLQALLAEIETDNEGLHALLRELAGEDSNAGLTDPDDIPEPAAEPYVKPGDLWQLGEHRLLCGDSTDALEVTRLMAEALVDCMWTDTPYGVSYVGKTADRLTIANDTATESDAVTLGAFQVAPMAPSARFYISCPAGPRHLAFHEAVAKVGWRVHQELVWAKGSIVLGHSDYHYAHEPLLYGFVPGPGRPGRGRHEGTRWYGDNSQSSVLEYPKRSANPDHANQKPVGLVEQCLRNSTAPGDIVYDPFAGSGTTLIAAEQLGRRCYAIELEPRYAQVIIERWQEHTGRTAERIDGTHEGAPRLAGGG